MPSASQRSRSSLHRHPRRAPSRVRCSGCERRTHRVDARTSARRARARRPAARGASGAAKRLDSARAPSSAPTAELALQLVAHVLGADGSRSPAARAGCRARAAPSSPAAPRRAAARRRAKLCQRPFDVHAGAGGLGERRRSAAARRATSSVLGPAYGVSATTHSAARSASSAAAIGAMSWLGSMPPNST